MAFCCDHSIVVQRIPTMHMSFPWTLQGLASRRQGASAMAPAPLCMARRYHQRCARLPEVISAPLYGVLTGAACNIHMVVCARHLVTASCSCCCHVCRRQSILVCSPKVAPGEPRQGIQVLHGQWVVLVPAMLAVLVSQEWPADLCLTCGGMLAAVQSAPVSLEPAAERGRQPLNWYQQVGAKVAAACWKAQWEKSAIAGPPATQEACFVLS